MADNSAPSFATITTTTTAAAAAAGE